MFDIDTEVQISAALSLEALFCFRAKRRAVLLADRLLNDEGRLHRLDETIAFLEKEGFILLPNSYSDSDITDHFLKVLKSLRSQAHLVRILQSFSLPLFDKKLHEIIAIILGIEEELNDRHVIWAVLSALLCPLRQSVGSCFATAPAILIHEEQLLQFLQDMQGLLTTGRLIRIFGGIEYTVPISPSPGLGELKKPFNESHPGFAKALQVLSLSPLKNAAHLTFLEVFQEILLKEHDLHSKDLLVQRLSPAKQERVEQFHRDLEKAKWHFVAFTDHLLLKMWEFTLASFVDVKTEFSRWNLFSSLGLHPDEKAGIGELIYGYLEQKLNEVNEKLDSYQREYEIAYDHVRATEVLLRGVSTEAEGRRLKAEHQARVYHLYGCEEMRDKYAQFSQNYAHFFSFLLEQIIAKFQEHFQEVYDAEMQEVSSSFDDAPAGFRLLFKHGRTHVGSWTFIQDSQGFIRALKEFFLAIENPLMENCSWEKGKEEISHLTTAIIHHVSTEEFLISAVYRMAKAHHVPLQKIPLDKMEKKPWAYTSGGTIPTLLKTYFRREGSLSEEARWVESPQDLLIFLIEILKMLPPKITDAFIRDPKKRLLMTSPTHAFSLLPGQELFRKGWEDPGFTYTWVRDEVLVPRQQFYSSIRLEPFEQSLLIFEFAKQLPLLASHELQLAFHPVESPVTIRGFCENFPELPAIDTFLYDMLPFVTPRQAEDLIKELNLKILAPIRPMGRRPFHDLIISSFSQYQSRDLHAEISRLMEIKGLSPPRPVVFADSNWSKFYFSFLVSPVTEQLELWRTDKNGITGSPMREWKNFMNGTIKEGWGVFFRPSEYSSYY